MIIEDSTRASILPALLFLPPSVPVSVSLTVSLHLWWESAIPHCSEGFSSSLVPAILFPLVTVVSWPAQCTSLTLTAPVHPTAQKGTWLWSQALLFLEASAGYFQLEVTGSGAAGLRLPRPIGYWSVFWPKSDITSSTGLEDALSLLWVFKQNCPIGGSFNFHCLKYLPFVLSQPDDDHYSEDHEFGL